MYCYIVGNVEKRGKNEIKRYKRQEESGTLRVYWGYWGGVKERQKAVVEYLKDIGIYHWS